MSNPGHSPDTPMALWVSCICPPSPSVCWSFSGAFSKAITKRVSFVRIESCAFSSPHISLIHPLITQCLPCCPLRANKWILPLQRATPYFVTQITPSTHMHKYTLEVYQNGFSVQYLWTGASNSQYFVPKPLTLTIWMSEHSKNSPEITSPLYLKVKDFSHSTGAVFTHWAMDSCSHVITVLRQDYLYRFFVTFCKSFMMKLILYDICFNAHPHSCYSGTLRLLIETRVVLIKTVTHIWCILSSFTFDQKVTLGSMKVNTYWSTYWHS